MKKDLIVRLHKGFEECARHEDGVEFWLARQLRGLLGYAKWENFEQVIARAKIACINTGYDVQDHFPDVGKMIDLGKGASREINDVALTRYACYLIAQNGDPRKNEIAFAMTYFAVQTRKRDRGQPRIVANERAPQHQRVSAKSILKTPTYKPTSSHLCPNDRRPL